MKRFLVRNMVETAATRDLKDASVYEVYVVPKLYMKMEYCISCAIHSHVVRSRPADLRRVREPPRRMRRDERKPDVGKPMKGLKKSARRVAKLPEVLEEDRKPRNALLAALVGRSFAGSATINVNANIFLGSTCSSDFFTVPYSIADLGTCKSFTEQLGGQTINGAMNYVLTNNDTEYYGDFYFSTDNEPVGCSFPSAEIDNVDLGACIPYTAYGSDLSIQLGAVPGSSGSGGATVIITSSLLFVLAVLHKML